MTQDIRKDLRIEEMSFTDRPSEKKNAHTHKPEVDREVRKCKAKRTYQW
jgi:hypothetical protein